MKFFFKMLKRALADKPPPGLQSLALERWHLRRAIRATENVIDEARATFVRRGGCPCCFWAAHAHGELSDLADKNERRQQRLQQINTRIGAQ